MANKHPSSSLEEFLTDAALRVEGAASDEDVSRAAINLVANADPESQFGKLLIQHEDDVAGVLSTTGAEQKQLLQNLLLSLHNELQKPDRLYQLEGAPIDAEAILREPESGSVKTRADSLSPVTSSLIERRKKQVEKQVEFARSAVKRFSSRSEWQAAQARLDEGAVEQAVTAAFSTPVVANSREEARRQVVKRLEQSFAAVPGASELIQQSPEIVTAVVAETQQSEELAETIAATTRTGRVVADMAIKHPEISLKDIAPIIEERVSRGVASDDVTLEAIKLGRAATILSSDIDKSMEFGAGSVNTRIIPKQVLAAFPKAADAVMRDAFSASWVQASETFTKEVTERLGTEVAQQPWLSEAIANGNKAYGTQKTAVASLTGGIQKFIAGFAGELREPPDEHVVESMKVWLELTAINSDWAKKPPTHAHINTMATYFHSPSLFQFFINDAGSRAVALGLRQVAQQGEKAVVAEGVKRGGMFLGARAFLTKILGTAAGGPAGLALSVAAERVLSWAGNFLNKIFSGDILKIGAAARGITAGFFPGTLGEPPQQKSQMFLSCALIAVIPIALVLWFAAEFIVPTSALIPPQGGGEEYGTQVYTGGPLTPSDITGCPTTGRFEIGQCPYNQSNYTHRKYHEDAYDISVPMGTEILATHIGKVVYIGTDRTTGYGVYVKLVGENASGRYYTIYAHLDSVVVEVDQVVQAGELLGYSDDTGNSTGAHLHYEYRNAQNVAPNPPVQFIPESCGYINSSGCEGM